MNLKTMRKNIFLMSFSIEVVENVENILLNLKWLFEDVISYIQAAELNWAKYYPDQFRISNLR